MATVTLKPFKVPDLYLECPNITPDAFAGKTPAEIRAAIIGPTGYTGYTASTGPTGYTGYGATGYTGYTGTTGYTGHS